VPDQIRAIDSRTGIGSPRPLSAPGTAGVLTFRARRPQRARPQGQHGDVLPLRSHQGQPQGGFGSLTVKSWLRRNETRAWKRWPADDRVLSGCWLRL
jgi:hypothetical protein